MTTSCKRRALISYTEQKLAVSVTSTNRCLLEIDARLEGNELVAGIGNLSRRAALDLLIHRVITLGGRSLPLFVGLSLQVLSLRGLISKVTKLRKANIKCSTR